MPLFGIEKLNNTQKSSLDLLQQVSGKLFEGVEQLGQLHLKVLRASTDAQFESLHTLASARDLQAFVEWQSSFVQPTAQVERSLEFNRQVCELISGTQTQIAKLAEHQMAADAKQVWELIGVIANSVSTGAEPVVAMIKSTLEAAGSVNQNANKTARQVAGIVENGITAMASAVAGQTTREASKATGGTRKKA